MKVGFFLSALLALSGLATNASYAQYHPATTNAVAKRPAVSSPASPGSRRGSIGGPPGKVGGIGGSTNKAGGINGTARPKF
jgi:hypothetical protein